MRVLLIVIVALACTAALDTSAAARSHCGGPNEPPCKVWERIPSCDAGLVEDFAKGKCVPQAKPTPTPTGCGKAGQNPCKVWERIPSCDAGLVEDFAKGRCVQPAAPIVCGKSGQRPCKVWERIPSCDRGLAEDFAQNRCARPQDIVRHAQVAACQGIVSAIRAGRDVLRLTEILPMARQRQTGLQNRFRQDPDFKAAFMSRAATGILAHQHAVPELKRIAAWLNDPRNRSALESIFSPESFCQDSVADTDQKLRRLRLAPTFAAAGTGSGGGIQTVASAQAAPAGHFFMGYQLTFGAGAGLGFQVGLMGVTDFRGAGGKHWFIGPQGITNVAGGVTGEVMFFPQVTLEAFKGWGWGVGISGGPPSKAVSAAVDVAFDESFSRFQGFGFGPGLGLGVIPGDVAVSSTHSWQY